MKFATLALIAGTASADQFPSFSMFHAHCQIDTTCAASCKDMMDFMAMLGKEDKEDKIGGHYKFYEKQGDQWVWLKRTTANGKYTDNIQIEGDSEIDNECRIVGKSQSEVLSYYDYETNYCNIYNLLFTLDQFPCSAPVAKSCKWQPTEAARECLKH